MQITLDFPDSLAQTSTFNQSDWMREIAIALFQQERISLSRASKIAGMELMDFQKLISDRGIFFGIFLKIAPKHSYSLDG